MKKEDILLLAQLLHTMEELTGRIEEDHNNGDVESLNSAKREVLKIQKKIGDLLNDR
tara:strand:- start:98 stop:268 length:171 start_codon:yes stop_codon:yes gene_type:complete